MKEKGVYSIWLCPQGETREKLVRVVNTLATEFNASAFEPHITIVPDFEDELEALKEKINKSTGKRPNIVLNFNGPDIGGSYYRCVYELAEVTPELQKIYTDIRTELGVTNLDIFPHMSLIYGDFDEETKIKISKRASELMKEEALLPLTFAVSVVTLFDTMKYVESEARVGQWKYAGEVGFGE